MKKIIITAIILGLSATNLKAQFGIIISSVDATIVSYTIDSLQIEVVTTFPGGPPAPNFVGVWQSKILNDTLFIHPLYEWPGSINAFGSGRYDTITIQWPLGINNIFINPGMRMVLATNPTGQDTILSNQNKTLSLTALAVSVIEKGFAVNVYPNPAQSAMTINLNFDNAQQCEIVLYDLVGRVVDANIFNGKIAAGEHQINLDLSSKARGQYLLEVKTETGKTIIPVHKR